MAQFDLDVAAGLRSDRTAAAVGEVERSDHRLAEGRDACGAHVGAAALESGGDAGQQSDAVLGADLQHRRVGRLAVEPPQRGWAARARLRVGAFLLAQPIGQRHLPGERPHQVGAQQRCIREPAEARLDHEAVDGHLPVRADRRLTDVEQMQREHSGGAVEHPDPVRCGDHDLAVAHDDRQLAGVGEAAALVVERRGGRWFGAAQRCAAPSGQLGDEAGLPLAPRLRAGRGGVGDRQHVQQFEYLDRSADRIRDDLDRDRVVQVTARRRVGQQQMVRGRAR